MNSFAEVSKQVHLIDDLILAEMICGKKEYTEESIEFSQHLLLTKYWFMRISWKNKRQFLLRLLEDVSSVWTLSLLLKSIWNCRPKDAVSSICEKQIWSSYDQVPMDNNRTALPESVLHEAMTNDRNWFSILEPDQQALVLSELLTVSGGPIMWEVLRIAQNIYEKHWEQQLDEILEYTVVNEAEKLKPVAVEQPKKETPRAKNSLTQNQDSAKQAPLPGQAQKDLDIALSTWNATVKSIRDSFKLEEIQMTYKDETTKTIWKVNRPKPESMETVDFMQLLPSVIGKRIFAYLPQTQYGDLSRVNKYWAFLIDEMKAEMLARQKINLDIDKLRDIILRHDQDLKSTIDSEVDTSVPTSFTKPTSMVVTKSIPSFGWRKVKVRKPMISTFKAIKKMEDLYERLDQRGASDENVWKWCSNILKLCSKIGSKNNVKQITEGTLPLEGLNFPCPLMVYKFKIPLEYPLVVDPTLVPTRKFSERKRHKRNKDLSILYPVIKMPSYLTPGLK